MFAYITKLINALNSNVKPSHISNGICLGLILGFMPKTNALWYLLFVFFFFLRINRGGLLLFALIGSLVAPALDGVFDKVGYAVLTYPKFEKFFSWIIDVPFVGFTRFNNTIVMGSLAVGLALYIPLCVILYFLIKLWRKSIAPKINHSVFAETLRKVPILGTITEKLSGIDLGD